MAETPGPETLRSLATGLHSPVSPAELGSLLAHAGAWDAERVTRATLMEQLESERLTQQKLTEQLAAAQKQVEVLEQDRKWWQDNAIKRHKRIAARGSARPARRGDEK